MNKEQEIINLLLEKVEELQWMEGVSEGVNNGTFYTNLGNSRITIERYSSEIHIDGEYIGASTQLEDRIVKIRSEAKAAQRNKTLDPVLNMRK
jgi:hypothetical protein